MESWTIKDILLWVSDYFQSKGIDSFRKEAEIILSEVLNLKRLDLYLLFEQEVSVADRAHIKELILRRAKHEPLQYILGKQNFYGYDFIVTPDVLIPRPETEILVEEILKNKKENLHVLDIGTGSGCIAITLKKHKPSWTVEAVDISPQALKIAQQNAKNLEAEIVLKESNLFEKINSTYDIIVSNPPYISHQEYATLAAQVVEHEPKTALVAENNGLFFYQEILKKAKSFLKKEGVIYFEIGHNQAESIRQMANSAGFSKVNTIKDYNDFTRIMIIEE